MTLLILFNHRSEETNKHIPRCVLSFKVAAEGNSSSLWHHCRCGFEQFSELLGGLLLGPSDSCLPFKDAASLPRPQLMCRNQGFWSLRSQAESGKWGWEGEPLLEATGCVTCSMPPSEWSEAVTPAGLAVSRGGGALTGHSREFRPLPCLSLMGKRRIPRDNPNFQFVWFLVGLSLFFLSHYTALHTYTHVRTHVRTHMYTRTRTHTLLPQPATPLFYRLDHFWTSQLQYQRLGRLLPEVGVYLFWVSPLSQGADLNGAWTRMWIWFHLAVKFFLQTRRSWL